MATCTRSIIDMLRKVLALTSSPVEGEAAAAAAHLARLLAKHNLDMADLETRGEAAAPGIVEQGHDLGKSAFAWKLALADMLADHYYCVSLTSHSSKTVAFAGRPDNVESLRLLYGWIITQIARIAGEERKAHAARTGEHVDPFRWQLGFGLGAVNRLRERLQERRDRESSEAGSALAIHHGVEISDYLEERYGYRRDGRKTKRQQEREAVWEAHRAEQEAREARMAKLKQDDPEAYYEERPWERPLTPEQQKKVDAENRRDEARRKRNETRRSSREYKYRPMSEAERVKLTQRRSAINAGISSADRINLEPFIETGVKDRTRIA